MARIWELHYAPARRDELRDAYSRFLLMRNLDEQVPGTSLYVMKKRGIFKTTVTRAGAPVPGQPQKVESPRASAGRDRRNRVSLRGPETISCNPLTARHGTTKPRKRSAFGFVFSCFRCLVYSGACGGSAPPPLDVPETGPITIAVAGDTLPTRPIDARDSRFAAVRDLTSGATLALANLNVNVLEDAQQADTARAAAGAAASWPFALPRDVATLRDLGIDVVSLANDHVTDYGADGLASTRRVLGRAGILDVGAGPDLAAARAALFIGRAADGRARVGVIAVAASSTSASRATASRADIAGRPGLNPLRYAADVTADPKTFQALAETAAAAGGGSSAGGDAISLFGTTIRKGTRTMIEFVVDERDEREILETIRSARRAAEFVIVSVHSHEPANASAEPAEFLRHFARRAIDAGAHAIVGHGPHRMRAVEAYGGGIILYSVGDFVYQTADVKPGAASEFDAGSDLFAQAIGAMSPPRPPDQSSSGASLLAQLEFGAQGLTGVGLEPLEIDADGIPRIASGQKRAEILEDLARLSAGSRTVFETAGAGTSVVLPPRQTRP